MTPSALWPSSVSSPPKRKSIMPVPDGQKGSRIFSSLVKLKLQDAGSKNAQDLDSSARSSLNGALTKSVTSPDTGASVPFDLIPVDKDAAPTTEAEAEATGLGTSPPKSRHATDDRSPLDLHVPSQLTPAEQHAAAVAPAPDMELGRLWDDAYDLLMADERPVVVWYEKIVLLRLRKYAFHSTAPGQSSLSLEPIEQITTGNLREPGKRRLRMCQLINAWSGDDGSRTGNPSRITEDHKPISVRKLLREKAERMPQAALGWAAVCIASEILSSPSPLSESDWSGIVYVASRMEWYIVLHRLLMPDPACPGAENPPETERANLRKLLVYLYKAVLSFSIGIVCRYYGTQTFDFSQNLLSIGLLDKDVSSVSEAETSLTSSIGREVKQELDKRLDTRTHASEPRVHQSDEETAQGARDSQIFDELHAIDPRIGFLHLARHQAEFPEDAYEWFLRLDEYQRFRDPDQQSPQVLRVTGKAGTGKSMLLAAVVQNLSNQAHESLTSHHVSYFFCGSHGGMISAASILKGLIGMLFLKQSDLDIHLDELRSSTGRGHFDHPNDFLALSGLFSNIVRDDTLIPTYFIVDVVEENFFKASGPSLRDFLSFIVTSTQWSPKIKWLVASGSTGDWPEQASSISRIDLSSRADSGWVVLTHINRRVSELSRLKGYQSDLQSHVAKLIEKRACGNYAWIHVACERLLEAETWHAIDILETAPSDLEAFFDYLDGQIDQLPYQDPEYCKSALSNAAIAYQPLHVSELIALTHLPPSVDLRSIIRKCSGFLELRDDDMVYFTHESAKTHATNVAVRRSDGRERLHSLMVRSCLDLLTAFFEGNTVSTEDTSTASSAAKKDPLQRVRYASFWWMTHASEIGDVTAQPEIVLSITSFLKRFTLRWLDALDDTGRLPLAVTSCRTFAVLIKKTLDPTNELMSVIYDTYHLLNLHASSEMPRSIPVENSLLFCPGRSLTKKTLLREHSNHFSWITLFPDIQQWTGDILVLWNHEHWVRQIVFSVDGRLIASACYDRTVRVWDAETGATQRVFSGHEDWVMSVDLSSNGLIASGSDDYHIRVWDLATGKLLNDLDLEESVLYVKFASDGSKLLAADGNISKQLWNWDMATDSPSKREMQTSSIAYSWDGAFVAWTDGDSVKISDTASLEVVHTIPASAKSLAFSSDGKSLATTRNDAISIWDTTSATEIGTLNGAGDVKYLAFSKDGASIASIYGDKIRLWDVANYKAKAIIAQTSAPLCVAFSPSSQYLVSSCRDGSIRFRFNGSSPAAEILESEQADESSISAIAVSADGLHIGVAQSQRVRIWDGRTGQPLETKMQIEHTRVICHLTFSQDGKKLATSSYDYSAKVCSVEDGHLIRTLAGHSDWVRQTSFSPDGRHIASASDDCTVLIWDLEGEPHAKPVVLEGHEDYVRCVSYSTDGLWVASGGDDNDVRVWDTKTWTLKWKLEGLTNSISHVVFYPKTDRILASSAGWIMVWDMATGERMGVPIKTEYAYRELWFDPRSTDYVMTDLGAGPIRTEPPGTNTVATSHAQHPSWAPYSITYDEDARWWITWKGRKVVYIPKEHSPTATFVAGHTVVIGCMSGKVLIFGFTPGVKPPSNLWVKE
ncbi:hypothetical protein CC80DRAFT_464155, partial [Byssothecium circinans]